jgi:hypothetical protein
MHSRVSTGKGAAPPLLTLLVTLAIAASFGALLYGVSSSLPFLASPALGDAQFGVLNTCAQGRVGSPTGFAVAPDGTAVVVFSGSEAVRCDLEGDGGARGHVSQQDGLTGAAFDFDGGLWLAAHGVWRADGSDAGFSDVQAAALTGTRHGVVAVEASGRVLALREGGLIGAAAQLPQALQGPVSLVTSSDGEHVALVVSGGVFVWDAATLKSVRAESPCAVETAWWLAGARKLLLACGPKGEFALEWDVESGEKTAVAARPRTRSALVPGLGVYVASCGQLPCTSSPP